MIFFLFVNKPLLTAWSFRSFVGSSTLVLRQGGLLILCGVLSGVSVDDPFRWLSARRSFPFVLHRLRASVGGLHSYFVDSRKLELRSHWMSASCRILFRIS